MLLQTSDGRVFLRRTVVISWLVVFLLGMYLEWDGHLERRLSDFSKVAVALERFRKDHGSYPKSNGSFSTKSDWIPELVPVYFANVPRDPRLLANSQNKQYLYISNGIDYKFVAHAPEDFGYVSKIYPEKVDPRRQAHAYGIWTPGASEW